MLNLVGLHGFWGRGRDWEPLLNHQSFKQVNSWCPDLFAPGPLSPQSFTQWCKNFSLEVERKKFDRPRILLGYSMGGRLAMHHLLSAPKFWDGAVIFSSHPGGLNPEEANFRKQWIEDWIIKFRTLSELELSRQWEAQEIFMQQPGAVQREGLPRELLVQALDQWSVLRHGFQPEDLKQIQVPILWLFGEKDLKYIRLMENMKSIGLSGKFEVIPGAGHRIINDAADMVATVLQDFFRQQGWLDS